MDNFQFYPTPSELAQIMVKPYRAELERGGCCILEPSAGDGDLLRALPTNASNRLDVVELDAERFPALEANLKTWFKNTRVSVRTYQCDYLTYTCAKRYTHVFMNPPFVDGAAHLLHAIKTHRGAQIACILNAETLKNAFTHERQILGATLADLDAQVQYIQSAFAFAKRRTNVEIALIRVRVPDSEFSFEQNENFADLKAQSIELEGDGFAALETSNFIANRVAEYDAFVREYEDLIKTARRLWNRYSAAYHSADSAMSLYRILLNSLEAPSLLKFNDGVEATAKMAWKAIFNAHQYASRLTTKTRREFENRFEQVATYDFTESNVRLFLQSIQANAFDNIKASIFEVFESVCMLSAHSLTSTEQERWKTNESNLLNKKIIKNRMVRIGFFGSELSLEYTAYDFLNDLDKIACFLSGKQFQVLYKENRTTAEITKANLQKNEWIFETEFFKIQCFKKGTMHLTWLDEALLDRFNSIIAERYPNMIPNRTTAAKKRTGAKK